MIAARPIESTDAVLRIRNLSIRLPGKADRTHAVQDVNLEVGRGEVVCLVGESGSGKSVIGQAIMGLLPDALVIDRGEVLLGDVDVVKASPAWLRENRCIRMSMIFQEPMTALNPVMRCGDQIDEVLRRHTRLPVRQRRAKVIDMLTQVRLPDPQRMYLSYPHQLSGGQRQRIVIAMALILDPDLVIADEPTTALDVTTQAQILRLVRDLQQQKGSGILFITHDFGVVAELADRVVVLYKGHVEEEGTRDEVLRAPRSAYTRSLLDAVPSLNPSGRRGGELGNLVLSIEKLSKTYSSSSWFGRGHQVHALKEVTLDIRRGEVVGIVGESGSGKSTLARCVARLVDPSGGRIQLGAVDIASMPARALRAHRQRFQIVFQDPYRSLNPRRTVGQSVMEGPLYFGLDPQAARELAEELMGLVRLDVGALSRYPHEFSGGQRQRICIARALAMQPELLIADEAVSALDVSVQKQVLELLNDIRRRLGVAILFITHDLRVAATLCDRVGVMHKGSLVELGPVRDVLENPRNAYTRELMAAAPGRDYWQHRGLEGPEPDLDNELPIHEAIANDPAHLAT